VRIYPCLVSFALFACASSEVVEPVLAPQDFADGCGVGTRPKVGSRTCVAVASVEVPVGFAPSKTGWGIHATVPAQRCAVTELALIGEERCVPLDDCQAVFPPVNVTATVRPGAQDAADGTVFGDLARALVSVRPGAVLALEAGIYPPIAITKSVTLVGACASKVVVQAPPEGADGGVLFNAAATVTLQSLTIAGFRRGAIRVGKRGSALALDRVILRDNRAGIFVGNDAKLTMKRSLVIGSSNKAYPDSVGIFASLAGIATVTETELRDLQTAFIAEDVGTKLTVIRSVAFETSQTQDSSFVTAFKGADLVVQESYLEAHTGRTAGVGASIPIDAATGQPAHLRFERSELVHRDVRREAGSAIDAYEGSSLELVGSALRHSAFAAIGASGGAKVEIVGSVVMPFDPKGGASALIASTDAQINVVNSALVGSTQIAVSLRSRAAVALQDSIVSGTLEEARVGDAFAFGSTAQAIVAAEESRVTLQSSSLVRNEGVGVLLLSGARADVIESIIEGLSEAPRPTFGIVALDSVASVSQSVIRRTHVGIAFARGRGLLQSSMVSDSDVALQIDTSAAFVEEAPAAGAGAAAATLEEVPVGQLRTQRLLLLRNGARLERRLPLTQ
jgi:hypothetical protein